jgi:hypothetical protein
MQKTSIFHDLHALQPLVFFWEPGCSEAETSNKSPLFLLPPAVLPRCHLPAKRRVYITTATGPSSLQCEASTSKADHKKPYGKESSKFVSTSAEGG